MLFHLCTGCILTSSTYASLDKPLSSQAVYLLLGTTLTFDTGFFCRHFLFMFRLLSDFLTFVFLLPMGMRLESDIIRTYSRCHLCVSATLSFIPSGLLSARVGSLL
jgi:hypothetical protein